MELWRDEEDARVVQIGKTWKALGPFQTGTREATWQADPFEQSDDWALEERKDKSYPSSLGIDGKVAWKTLPEAEDTTYQYYKDCLSRKCSAIDIDVTFPEIDWTSLQAIYGWAAFQWQAWSLGTFQLDGTKPQTTKIFVHRALEYILDGERHFGGDLYGFGKAPLIKVLEPGQHTLAIRVVRDVRAMGGVGEPSVKLNVCIDVVEPHVDILGILRDDCLFPDMVVKHGYAGNVCSFPVANLTSEWVEIVRGNTNADKIEMILQDKAGVSIAPGQTKAINFDLRITGIPETPWAYTTKHCPTIKLSSRFELYYRYRGSDKVNSELWSSDIFIRKALDPQKMTFKLPNGTVSHALLLPPHTSNGGWKQTDRFPILVMLHGAGVEADSKQTKDMLKPMGAVRAWTIVPTGGTAWSADDWHTWGWADVEAAIAAIPSWIITTNYKGPGVDINNLYVVGHSNGGQGTWHALTHIPDKIVAAAPVSGYASIQKYVPYTLYREVDPRISAVHQAALTPYRHELLLPNANGIPIQQQHGSADDNVPPFHSRRMFELLIQDGQDPGYTEIAGKGHWYDNIMTTPQLQHFYHQRISKHEKRHHNLPKKFSIVIPSTGDPVGSRGGIVVDQLSFTGQLGRLDIERTPIYSWKITTSNIHRFHLGSADYEGFYPTSIVVDDMHIDLVDVSAARPLWLHRGSEIPWTTSRDSKWQSLAERSSLQAGTITAILRTKATIQVRYQSTSETTFRLALQTSRNLYQYYGANTDIVQDAEADETSKGNIVTLVEGSPEDTTEGWTLVNSPNHPIEICTQGIKIQCPWGAEKVYKNQPGLGAIYLVPKPNERLQLAVWGVDKKGLEHAARLIPGLTGVGQPDFVVFGPESSWKGLGGVLAMGFFNHDWSISAASYIS